jgi:AcrR family transcriptional regulator
MQTRAIETRQTILDAAIKCFSHAGYNATGVAEICETAGISKGAFYHHFPSKHAIFLALMENWLDNLDVQLKNITSTSKDVPSGLVAMANVLPGIFTDAEDQVRMYLEFWTQATRDPIIFDTMIRPYNRYTRYFASLIENGVSEGSLNTQQPELISKVIIAIAIGVLLQGLLDQSGTDWKNVAEAGMKFVMAGISKEKP